MKCPYCGNEMREGKICAIGSGAALEWKERGKHFNSYICYRSSVDRMAVRILQHQKCGQSSVIREFADGTNGKVKEAEFVIP